METIEQMTLDKLKTDIENITEVESCVVVGAKNSKFPGWRIITLEYLYRVQDGRMLTKEFEVLEKDGNIDWYKSKPAVLRESITPREFHKTQDELKTEIQSMVSGSVDVIDIHRNRHANNDIISSRVVVGDEVQTVDLICYNDDLGQCQLKFLNK